MLSGPSFRSPFVFSIKSLTLPGFHLISFHSAEVSLSAFSWFYTLVCSCPRISRIHIFTSHLSINVFFFSFFAQLETNKQNQNKSKTNASHIQIDHALSMVLLKDGFTF